MKPPQLKILSEQEKKKLVAQLNKQFGIKKVDGMISMRGQERLFLFQGNFTEKQIRELESTLPVERVGIYFGKNINGQIRLSIEGTQILKNQITKNIFELSDEQLELWMRGNEILFDNWKKHCEFRKEDIPKTRSDNSLLHSGEAGGGWRRASQTSSANQKNFKGFVVIKYKNNFLGCGKASAEKITNFIPKNRRLKEKI